MLASIQESWLDATRLDAPRSHPIFFARVFVYVVRECWAIVRDNAVPLSGNLLIVAVYGHVFSLRGNKNGSVFRKHLGGALMRRMDTSDERIGPWLLQGGPSFPDVEESVSRLLREGCSCASDYHLPSPPGTPTGRGVAANITHCSPSRRDTVKWEIASRQTEGPNLARSGPPILNWMGRPWPRQDRLLEPSVGQTPAASFCAYLSRLLLHQQAVKVGHQTFTVRPRLLAQC
jgi:hypothetical protein